MADLAEWSLPQGGMFLWMRIPRLRDTWDMIMERGLEKNIMLVPGRVFAPRNAGESQYLRASYSVAAEDRFDEAFRRLAELVREEIQREDAARKPVVAVSGGVLENGKGGNKDIKVGVDGDLVERMMGL